MPSLASRSSTTPIEARSGLDAWQIAELPEPPRPHGLAWLSAVGPGVIALGVSIGSGEFLLGPAAFVAHGFSLFWIVIVAITLQTLFNTEVMRYTLATGEPVFTGFMRTRPSSRLWAWVYATLYFLQVGWPAWAGTAAAAIFFLFSRRLAVAADGAVIYAIAVTTFLGCVAVLTIGRRIERTLEILNWVLVLTILGGFFVLTLVFVSGETWLAAAAGFVAVDLSRGTFDPLPSGADFFLVGALVAYSGSGGVVNIVLANWARDRGYGMGERAGYIPAAATGERGSVAASGFTFGAHAQSMDRWRGWWRIISADQWGLFFAGGVLGMLLPALLYVTFLPRGTNIQGFGISASLASAIATRAGAVAGGVIAFLGAWLLFKTQLDNLEGMVRAITDILWTGSRRVRAWRGGDIRAIYYTVLAVLVVWGLIAMRIAQPIVLLQLGANVAGAVFVLAAPHLLYINTCLLPEHVRPPMWRRAALVVMTLFYGFFVVLSFGSLLRSWMAS